MKARSKLLAVQALLFICHSASAEIDSGGGKTSGGALVNHSSIGEPFATIATANCTTDNQPGLIEVLYPVPPPSLTDSDQNGLPDFWENFYFQAIGVDPQADADHDGNSNWMEYLAGTDPKNGSCFFQPQGTFTAGIFQMPVQTVLGRSYQVWVSRDLKDWHLQESLTGDGSEQLFQFDETTITSGPLLSPVHPSNYFFRIQILIP